MRRDAKYYDMHGEMDRSFLHPGGREATEKLLSLLPSLGEDSTIVEIGCGVGATARLIMERFRCSYIGIDSSSRMLDRARERLGEHNSRVTLIECDVQIDRLPLAAESVSAVIAESVFAILEPRKIFGECYNVLKNEGIVVWNDRIWGESVSLENRLKVNDVSKKLFGFHAAPEDLPTAEDWKKFVESKSFRMISCEQLSRNDNSVSISNTKLFTERVMVLRLLAQRKFLRFRYYDYAMKKKFGKLWTKMENWIFMAQKELIHLN